VSWRADLLANRKAFTRGAADPVVTRAKFTLAENPALIQAVQNAQSPQEAHTLMADAWKLVRYNKHGGENAARLATTHARANSFAGGQMLPGMPAPCGTSMGSTAGRHLRLEQYRRPGHSRARATLADSRPRSLAWTIADSRCRIDRFLFRSGCHTVTRKPLQRLRQSSSRHQGRPAAAGAGTGATEVQRREARPAVSATDHRPAASPGHVRFGAVLRGAAQRGRPVRLRRSL
jgi:hypothetical protein